MPNTGRRIASIPVAAFLLALYVSPCAPAQEPGSVVSEQGLTAALNRFRLKAEAKIHGRASASESVSIAAAGVPVPVTLATVDPHGGFEVSNVALIGEADVTPDISAKLVVHFLDLYNRNPTSSDDRVFVREAWVRFGKKLEALKLPPGTTFYVQAGKAPRFTKRSTRNLESYGLWETAVARFEEIGLEAGGSFGTVLYWRAHVVNGNPLFFRDPNALAGDNGTPERTFGSTTPVVYNSGFPILYDAKSDDVNFRGQYQVGGGLGVRFAMGGNSAVDLLGWYFRRTLADRVSIRGSFYSGDLRLLQGFPGGVSLPIEGRDKIEWGGNLEARFGRLQLFGQYVHQEIAGLVRHGYEAEAAYRFPLNGLFASGDSPVVNWVQPTVRVSAIHNDFGLPAGFVDPSMTWNWQKYDFGVRIGIVRGLDLTLEYARHDAILKAKVIHPDELLTTLRVAF